MASRAVTSFSPTSTIRDDPSGSPRGSFTQPGALGRAARAYGVGAYPTFYLIGPDGRVVWANDGEQPDALLRQLMSRAAGG